MIILNSWITRSIGMSYRGHCDMQMCHSGEVTLVISQLRMKAPNIKTTIVVDRSHDN